MCEGGENCCNALTQRIEDEDGDDQEEEGEEDLGTVNDGDSEDEDGNWQ